MITCKKCGYEGAYTGKPCPDCGEKFKLTGSELGEEFSYFKKAIKDKRYKEALECCRILADEGYTEAEKEYAAILEKGKLVQKNLGLAAVYYLRAAKKNDAFSAYKYAVISADENEEEAAFWLIYSSVLGCVEAYRATAERFEMQGYEDDAHYFYSLAADSEDKDAVVTMAKRYYSGVGTAASEEYAKWYMDKLRFPPIYAIKLAYKLRKVRATEPPKVTLKSYSGLLRSLANKAKKAEYNEVHLNISKMLAERGDAEATIIVAKALVSGDLCKQNFTEGLKLLSKCASSGSAKAYSTIADIYFDGKYTERNVSVAIKNYAKAGELGDAAAYEKIGDIYYTGMGMEPDLVTALSFYERAELLGSESAQKKANKIKSERCAIYERAKGLEQKAPEEAFRLYAISTAMGHINASYRLAECYEYGIGTKKNRHGAYYWYEKAAARGECDAMFRLGLCYARGIGTKLDYAKAREMLVKAKKHGSRDADEAIVAILQKKAKKLSDRLYSSAMRLIYQKKFDPAKNRLEIAAELMHPKAIYTLGCMYEFGMGVPTDKQKGYRLYETSYSLFFRDPRSKYKLSILRMLKAYR